MKLHKLLSEHTLFAYFIALFMGVTTPVFAGGFHYEIDVTTTLETDADNNLQSLQMLWIHDEKSSALLLEGGDLSTPEIKQLTLNSLAEAMLKDLHKVGYLTNLEAGISRIKTTKAQDYQIQLDNGKLALRFRLPLKSPYSMDGNKRLKLFHEDPKGTALLQYQTAEQIIFSDSLKTRCQSKLNDKYGYEHREASQIIEITCQ
jgi:ABC-type uncharacterized transport system substrate-binding protein